ncbi:hypothetical protein KP509_11G041700 [Ceratopteris richardii]|nr:hypothetical protein KP509_11G041700 [Ceratopteris richardii]
MTGKKVLQMKLVDPESSVYWEPIRDGYSVKLKTISGGFLRANGSIPPWRNSVTHDSTHKEDWLLWEVVPVGDSLQNEGLSTQKPSFKSNGSYTMGDNLQHEGLSAQNPSFKSNVSFSQEPSIVSSVPSFKEETVASKPKVDGRKIYYAVAGDDGEIPDDFDSEITFIGHNVKMLAEKLKEETGIEEDIYVCAKNHKTKRLFPLLLQLPPQNSDMYVVVVKASSTLARTLGGGDEKVQRNDDVYS